MQQERTKYIKIGRKKASFLRDLLDGKHDVIEITAATQADHNAFNVDALGYQLWKSEGELYERFKQDLQSKQHTLLGDLGNIVLTDIHLPTDNNNFNFPPNKLFYYLLRLVSRIHNTFLEQSPDHKRFISDHSHIVKITNCSFSYFINPGDLSENGFTLNTEGLCLNLEIQDCVINLVSPLIITPISNLLQLQDVTFIGRANLIVNKPIRKSSLHDANRDNIILSNIKVQRISANPNLEYTNYLKLTFPSKYEYNIQLTNISGFEQIFVECNQIRDLRITNLAEESHILIKGYNHASGKASYVYIYSKKVSVNFINTQISVANIDVPQITNLVINEVTVNNELELSGLKDLTKLRLLGQNKIGKFTLPKNFKSKQLYDAICNDSEDNKLQKRTSIAALIKVFEQADQQSYYFDMKYQLVDIDEKEKADTWLKREYCWFRKATTGYMLKPGKVVLTYFLVLLFFAVIYYFNYNLLAFSKDFVSFDPFIDSLYFSAISALTIGYGDIQPTGWLRIVASLEGLLGVVLVALFSVILSRRYGR